MKKALERDYTFDEWDMLSSENKREIWNHYWQPYEPSIGKITRDAIIREFKNQHPNIAEKAIEIGYRYFGWYVGCIYVVVESANIRVPLEFSDVTINKGVVLDKKAGNTCVVKWRHCGKSDHTLGEYL